MDVAAFQDRLRRDGYVTEISGIAPDVSRAPHAHPFDVAALVIEGALTLTCDGRQQTYRPGDEFTMPAGTMHGEDTGADGVRYVVGRRT